MISVVKIGGNVIDNADALEAFVKDFAALPEPKVLVHGGGKLATAMSQKLGIETHMVDGRRITDKETLDVVTMMYGGLVNKNIVCKLQREGCNAIGLSGADANIIPANKRPPQPIDYGFVGDIKTDQISTHTLKLLLENHITPVFCALTHDGEGHMLNTNADSVASALAVALTSIDKVNLVYCFELPGVMQDISNPDSLITDIDKTKYAELKKAGIINKGMIPKIDNAFNAIAQGVDKVIIKSSAHLTQHIGTTIHE